MECGLIYIYIYTHYCIRHIFTDPRTHTHETKHMQDINNIQHLSGQALVKTKQSIINGAR